MSLTSEIVGAGVSSAGSVISAGLNMLANKKAFEHQKELQSSQYDAYLRAARAAGASPAAISQGLTGKGPAGTPTVSTGGNPAPDIDPSVGITAAASANESNASAARQLSERDFNMMRLRFEPQKYFADVQKSFSEVFKNRMSGMRDSAEFKVLQETAKSIEQKRPWEIAGLQQGLLNQMQEYNRIIAQTHLFEEQKNTEKSLQGYYNSGSALNYEKINTEKSLQGFYNSGAELNWSNKFNADLQSFQLQFENFLRSQGWNPSKDPWDNISRWIVTDPKKFKLTIDNLSEGVKLLDTKLQDELGKTYKRDIFGLYMGHKTAQFWQGVVGRSIPAIIGAASGNPAFGVMASPVQWSQPTAW